MDLSSRVTKLNDYKVNTKCRYVLYWMQMFKYALDGRDPNSYAGILWCFGKHDRPWFEREILGTIRYMTSRSMAKKFNARGYMGSV
jgi:deoxyribodipyrimidine photolyase